MGDVLQGGAAINEAAVLCCVSGSGRVPEARLLGERVAHISVCHANGGRSRKVACDDGKVKVDGSHVWAWANLH